MRREAAKVYPGYTFVELLGEGAGLLLRYAAWVFVALVAGISIRGVVGIALALIPIAIITVRQIRRSRICVEIDGDRIQYEGPSPRDDFSIARRDVKHVYQDEALGGMLVIVDQADGEHYLAMEPRRGADLLGGELLTR